MNPAVPLRRRRFIAIAAAAGLPLLYPGARTTAAAPLHVWTGSALGADATLQIQHPDPLVAERLIADSLREVARLEHVFSLYRPDSALVRLNRDGRLDDPPADLLRLLAQSARFSQLTDGAFDPTVQPLWDLYARHFSRPDADPGGPPHAAIAAALRRVGYRNIALDARQIRLAEPGMALTLNGIAQGYITDRVVELLRNAGLRHALVDMGEIGAIGGHPSGAPWRVGLQQPGESGRSGQRIALQDQAVSTSGGYGTPLDPAGRFNHIFDPGTGGTSWRYRAVSVVAPDATTADALSTAFSLMPLQRAAEVARMLDLQAWFVRSDGHWVQPTATM
jgi:thiamine biosynthesis lipoprotein